MVRLAGAGAGAVTVLLGVVIGAGPAYPAAPAASGWWTTTSAPASVGSALGPDVPEGGLLVQSGSSADQPVAYAALRFDIGAEEVPATLTLSIAPNGGSTSGTELTVCRVPDPSFQPAAGGPASDAPRYDCSRSAKVAPQSNAYAFDVSGLGSGGAVAFAVLPGASTGRVVLSKPGADALHTTPGTRGALSDVDAPAGDAAAFDAATSDLPMPVDQAGAASTAFDLAPPAVIDMAAPLTATPATPVAPTPVRAAAPTGDDSSQSIVAAPVDAAAASAHHATPGLIAMGLAALAATAWMAASRSAGRDDDQPSLVMADEGSPT